LVETTGSNAATANIAVQTLRGNIRVLMSTGGNIAVLPGRDGKLLVDAGLAGSRTKMVTRSSR
jgi:hypothetical protein